MTLTDIRRRPAAQAPALPQVNLLPPEIRGARSLEKLKRSLGIGLGALTAVGLAGFGGSLLVASGAQADLAEAEARTQELVAQQAQYAEVPRVLGQLQRTERARQTVTSTEILWADYLSALAATAPAGVSIETLGIEGVGPLAAPGVAAGPLQDPSVSVLSFIAHSRTLPDTAAWLDELRSVPGFNDPWFTSATVTDEDGTTYYTVSATVQVNEAAYALRFADEEES